MPELTAWFQGYLEKERAAHKLRYAQDGAYDDACSALQTAYYLWRKDAPSGADYSRFVYSHDMFPAEIDELDPEELEDADSAICRNVIKRELFDSELFGEVLSVHVSPPYEEDGTDPYLRFDVAVAGGLPKIIALKEVCPGCAAAERAPGASCGFESSQTCDAGYLHLGGVTLSLGERIAVERFVRPEHERYRALYDA